MRKRPSQHDDESAMEFLRRVVSNCDHEYENYLDDLPSVEAVLDFFDLWHTYDTDFWAGVLECISEGDDPEPARAFIRKWKLGRVWTSAVNESVKIAKEEAKLAKA